MSESSDPYLYPGTDVLRNIPGIRNSEQLTAFETLNTGARIYELELMPIPGRFNTTERGPKSGYHLPGPEITSN